MDSFRYHSHGPVVMSSNDGGGFDRHMPSSSPMFEKSVLKLLLGAIAVIVLASPLGAQSVDSAAKYPLNQLHNPDFDVNIESWSPSSGAILSWVGSSDVNGDPQSGAMMIVQPEDAPTAAIAVAVCGPVQEDSEYLFGGYFFVGAEETGNPSVRVQLTAFDDPFCEGNMLSSSQANATVLKERWYRNAASGITPSGSLSASITVEISHQTTDELLVHADSMFLFDITTMIFYDGFESGDTRAWGL